jgi:hypothetical protein
MDAYPWQKLTWPMARWAKNPTNFFETLKKPLSQAEDYHTYTTSNSTSISSDTL